MSVDDVERLVTKLAEALRVPIEQLVPGAALVDDLGVDPLGFVEVAAVLESEEARLSEDDVWALQTVEDVFGAWTRRRSTSAVAQ